MRILYGTLLLVAAVALPVSADILLHQLQGTWKSDKDATLAELRKHDHWTEERIKLIEGILGKMTVRFSGKTMQTEFLDLKSEVEPNVKKLEDGRIRIEYTDQTFGKQVSIVEVSGDSMWVTWPETPIPFRERFARERDKAEPPR